MKPRVYPSHEHAIDPSMIDSDALKVLNKLHQAGFEAYLVGGGVRDLLVKRPPKDYDISTSALPEQVKKIFQRQCLLIGRRFRLAHVRFGHKIIEVSTFRSGEMDSDLIVQDNVWGTPEQDVLRRDFTINGLFYDPAAQTIIDYVGGWEDIKKRVLRSIGDPVVRFKQDPVRMIRLLKFRARFSFEIDAQAREALFHCRQEIIKSSPARVLEEIFRMLESGASAPFFMLMLESRLLELLFPALSHFLQSSYGQGVFKYLALADKVNRGQPKAPLERSFMCACLLFPILEAELQQQYLDKQLVPHIGDVMRLSADVVHAVLTTSFSHFPRRISTVVGFIMSLQFRLTPFSGKKHPRPKTMRMKEFEMALQFLKMRAAMNSQYMEDLRFWSGLYRQQAKQHEHRSHKH